MFGDVDVTKPSDAIIVSVNKLSTVVLRTAVALMSPSGLILTTYAITICLYTEEEHNKFT